MTNIGVDRPDATGISQSLSNPTTAAWFNTAAFTLQPLYSFGNAGRNAVMGPPGFYWDFSTHKDFRLPNERHVLQFRWEAFNVLNHPQFDLPNATIGNAQAGIISTTLGTPRNIQLGLRLMF